jgi:hypothetical protein
MLCTFPHSCSAVIFIPTAASTLLPSSPLLLTSSHPTADTAGPGMQKVYHLSGLALAATVPAAFLSADVSTPLHPYPPPPPPSLSDAHPSSPPQHSKHALPLKPLLLPFPMTGLHLAEGVGPRTGRADPLPRARRHERGRLGLCPARAAEAGESRHRKNRRTMCQLHLRY